jgi:photosystem II stability/assembly factor-like uncharacterized protein
MNTRNVARIFMLITVAALLLTACQPAATPTPTAAAATATTQPTEALPTASPVPPTAAPTATSAPTETAAPEYFAALRMFDAQTGWVMSDRAIYTTADGADSLTVVKLPENVTLSGQQTFFALDAQHAWFVVPAEEPETAAETPAGAETAAVTEATTEAATVAATQAVTETAAATESTQSAAEEPVQSGILYATSDGGATWTQVAVPFANGIFSFTDASTGWLMTSLSAGAGSEQIALYATTDGGATWSQVFKNAESDSAGSASLPLSGMKTGMAFLNSTTGWIVGEIPEDDVVYLYRTSDGGATWARQTINLPEGVSGVTVSLQAPVFFSESAGVLPVGLHSADKESTVLYTTSDSGKTWTASAPVESKGLAAVASLTDAFVWDGGASLYATHDGGATWTTVTPNLSLADSLAQLQFVDASTGFAAAAGANGVSSLYRTSDGGATWTQLGQ